MNTLVNILAMLMFLIVESPTSEVVDLGALIPRPYAGSNPTEQIGPISSRRYGSGMLKTKDRSVLDTR